MADMIVCQSCGAPDQLVGKFCEQCGSKVELVAAADAAAPDPAVATDDAPASAPAADAVDAVPDGGEPRPDAPPDTADVAPITVDPRAVTMRFIRLENGVLNRDHAFDVPVGGTLLVGRTDPANGVFPEVDVTMWAQRVVTPEGSLYTIHRRQCYISRDDAGQVWIVDCPEYVGDTMVSPVGSSQFRTIPNLADERETNEEGGIKMEVGDRILMGQGEGMLIFQLVQI